VRRVSRMVPRIFFGAAILVLLGVLAFLAVVFTRLAAPPVELRPDRAGMQWVRSLYGFGPAAEEQLRHPYSVAIGPDGRIYAAEPAGGRIMVFSPYGRFERVLSGGDLQPGQGGFAQPEAVDVSHDGELFIADSQDRKIVAFGSDGEFAREWRVDYMPRGIAASAGSIYVLGEGTVNIYTESGAKTGQFGTRGPDPGQIDAYIGIEVFRDTVFIADAFNRRIQAFDRAGNLLWARPQRAEPRSPIETSTPGPRRFSWDLPQDLVVDSAGRLVVVDAFLFQLVVLDPESGEILATHGDFGQQEGAFIHPTSIEYDPQRDWFAVADTDNNRVQIVRLPGSGADLISGAWRLADSTARWVAPTMLALILVLLLALIQWFRAARLQKAGGAGR